MDRQPDRVECGRCGMTFAPDFIPNRCPACQGTTRAYIIGLTRNVVVTPEPAQLRLTTHPPQVTVTTDRDEVRVPYEIARGADERTRLLARIQALIAAIRAIADGVVDFDNELFMGRLGDLTAALGVAKGTEKDIAGGRVTD